MTLRPPSEWEREYRQRFDQLSDSELRRVLRVAEAKNHFRKALAIRRELDARHRAVLGWIDGGCHG